MMKKFYPTRGYTVLERKHAKEETIGKIIVQTNNNDPFFQGKVLSIGKPLIHGSGMELEIQYQEGDVVLYDRSQVTDYHGFDIVPHSAVIGILEE